MVNLGITKVSSKGQIVIPSDMRNNFKAGDKLIIVEDEDRIVLKKAEGLTEQMEEDFEFAKRTEEAWKRMMEGKYIGVDSENLFEEMEKW